MQAIFRLSIDGIPDSFPAVRYMNAKLSLFFTIDYKNHLHHLAFSETVSASTASAAYSLIVARYGAIDYTLKSKYEPIPCVSGESPVFMASGDYKPARLIQEGEWVKTETSVAQIAHVFF